jgi:hypothetical protein
VARFVPGSLFATTMTTALRQINTRQRARTMR